MTQQARRTTPEAVPAPPAKRSKARRRTRLAGILAVGALLTAAFIAPQVTSAQAADGHAPSSLSAAQNTTLLGIARDTWAFFGKDVDPVTHLPLDNLGPGAVRGSYTSAANIGLYLEAVVSANDLKLIGRPEARSLLSATLKTVATMQRSKGFLLQWYDTATGRAIRNPGDIACATEPTPTQDNCSFLSAVDNGWYASGLMVVRQAMPELASMVDSLIAPMDFSIFYDSRAQSNCNTNPAIAGNQPTGQMYGGYYVGQGPAGYHNGALYSDPRIAMYVGMGLHQMPGDVWWRTWRTLPPKQCATDPDFSWQGQAPTGLDDNQRPAVGKAVPGLGGPLHLPGYHSHAHPDLGRWHVRGPVGQ
jgi:hypothetical protein